jgi:hypothetical protein
MIVEPHLIAAPKVGLERDIEPWLLPEGAYPDLQDCYLWRGRIKRRKGFSLLGQLNRSLGASGTTDGAGNLTFTIPGFSSGSPMTPGASQFIVGTTTYRDGTITPGGDPITLLVNGVGTATLDRGAGGNPGQLIITGGPHNTPVFYYPGLPVMGLAGQELLTLNVGDLVAFDTVFAYVWSNNNASFGDASNYKGTTTTVTWSAPNYQLFWTTNYANCLWATNYKPGIQTSPIANTVNGGDGIRWYDEDQTGWVNFLPQVDSTNYLQGCLMIFPYKGRLVVLNTFEGPNNAIATRAFTGRARWSENGTPFYTNSPAAAIPTFYKGGSVTNAWRSDLVGLGGYIDAPTLEAIVSAEFVKDSIVVYFEKSTWRLVYTGNEVLPFIWEKINTELGAISTFSVVPFDKVAIAISDVGIHACDTVNVLRIDDLIPDEVFGINIMNQGGQRTYGIRDYANELVYWSIPYIGGTSEFDPDTGEQPIFPNKILTYNYKEGYNSYSFFNDSFTCFGYLPPGYPDLTWAEADMNWEDANFPWIGIENPNGTKVIGGNQQGYVEILQDRTLNDVSLFISNVTLGDPTVTISSPNHNLTTGDFVKFVMPNGGITNLDSNIFEINVPKLPPNDLPDPNNFTIQIDPENPPTGVYTGPGQIVVVNNLSILTKRFNPYMGEGAQVRLAYIDFYLDRTTNGQIEVNIFANEDSNNPINSNTSVVVGSNLVNTFPESTYQSSPDVSLSNSKLWKRLYVESISQLFQIQITLSDAQMEDDEIVESDIVLHGMILWMDRAGRLIDV